MHTRWVSLAILLILVLAGCTQVGDTSPLEPQVPSSLDTEVPSKATSSENGTPTPDSSSQEIATPDRTSETMTIMPERVPPTEETNPVTGEVPIELLDSILRDLAGKTGAALEKITVIQAQAMVWNDGSLGCGKPGEFYTQALVNGYWVILEIESKRYDYRATDKGYFFMCEDGLPPNPSSGTPSS